MTGLSGKRNKFLLKRLFHPASFHAIKRGHFFRSSPRFDLPFIRS
ncbi:hypothetical protein HMPREF3038_00167 [Akkermansia sp. KLE1797]|nr:hypothetical protein HMPREF3038_00167 [Akkermansia sp. KLE1797]KXU55204.1 hypothetical protein HMPREF3039_00607 [Akkermansia sp. KLE1798]KZA05206.1 hypothetical protein HMPREF1326_01091 [Akkermansia sp. KLE1605]